MPLSRRQFGKLALKAGAGVALLGALDGFIVEPHFRLVAERLDNGPALTFFVVEDPTKPQKSVPQSSNLYNNYGRDVGYAKKDSPTGDLRLTRNGYIYNSYYRDKFNQAWVLSGSVAVPALAEAVFLRLGAKHWPKKGKTAPNNQFRFSRFELFQW